MLLDTRESQAAGLGDGKQTTDPRPDASVLVADPSSLWQPIAGKFWQLFSPEAEPTEVTDREAGNRGTCPAGMVEVRGQMRRSPDPALYAWSSIDRMQHDACVDWLHKTWPFRCRSFSRELWLRVVSKLRTRPSHFCIDRFEYPNIKGQYPIVHVTWTEAAQLCRAQGKRLCGEEEWTFACEGEEALPYPNGYERDAEACVIDHPGRPYSSKEMYPRTGERARRQLARVWQGETSGSHPRCASPFGVHDLTGNVDEWTVSAYPKDTYRSVLKGGYWGRGQNRCRAATRAHYEHYLAYQQGFRCCSDTPTSVAATAVPVQAAP